MTNSLAKDRPTYSFMISVGSPETDVFGRSFDTPEEAENAMNTVIALIGVTRISLAGYGRQFVKDGINGIEMSAMVVPNG